MIMISMKEIFRREIQNIPFSGMTDHVEKCIVILQKNTKYS